MSKRKFTIKIRTDKKPNIRIPVPRPGQVFKDKKKYTRKVKHKNNERP